MPLLVTKGMGKGGSGLLAFLSTGITPAETQLIVQLNNDGVISGPAASPSGYTITVSGPGNQVTVTGVSISGDQLTLHTTPHTPGASYTLHMPTLGLVSTDARVYQGDFEIEYTGPAAPAIVQLVRSLDARTIEVVFSRAVNQQQAEDITNYSISPTLVLHQSNRVSDFHYRLITEQQVLGQTYNVTVTNVGGL